MKSKFVTIGLVQSKVSADIPANVKKTEKMVRQAAKKGAQIICLQELFLSHYFCQGPKDKKYFSLAETVPGPTTTLLSKLAKEYNVVILCSIFEKTKNKIF
jgi:N-carbamoylputrescine amidase